MGLKKGVLVSYSVITGAWQTNPSDPSAIFVLTKWYKDSTADLVTVATDAVRERYPRAQIVLYNVNTAETKNAAEILQHCMITAFTERMKEDRGAAFNDGVKRMNIG
jgi:hypothetical protein